MNSRFFCIRLGEIDFRYVLRKDRRAKSFRIIFYSDNHCVVTVPFGFGRPSAEQFLLKHSHWVKEKLRQSEKNKKIVSSYYDQEEYLSLKKKAHAFVIREIKECNAYYGFSYEKISIRNQRSRWGSCSSSGTLSFHYKILFLPLNLAHYIIVHELCHIKEMNHSEKFWELVSLTFPDHKKIRKQLILW
ncbi:MAG: M48 family metallopeptidase [Candidatus Moraniibacteriota bacterium]|nr:MAG: M48 family metallopeptidase [Candidatus Moranbacteria bacterium]